MISALYFETLTFVKLKVVKIKATSKPNTLAEAGITTLLLMLAEHLQYIPSVFLKVISILEILILN